MTNAWFLGLRSPQPSDFAAFMTSRIWYITAWTSIELESYGGLNALLHITYLQPLTFWPIVGHFASGSPSFTFPCRMQRARQ